MPKTRTRLAGDLFRVFMAVTFFLATAAGIARLTAADEKKSPKSRSADDAEGISLPDDAVPRLKFRELFRPPGRRGLEYSEQTRSLDGKRVRILGYMAAQDEKRPGMLLLTPLPFTLHEHEYGLAEDLPSTTVHVFLPEAEREKVLPLTPGLLLLTGTLSVGPRQEADGRSSLVRLALDPRPENGQDVLKAKDVPRAASQATEATRPSSESKTENPKEKGTHP
jgi:hypothetical protein